MNDRKTPIADDDFDSIAPAEVALTWDAPSTAETSGRPRRRGLFVGLAVGLLIMAGLVLLLPGMLRPDLESIATGPATPAPSVIREREGRDGRAPASSGEQADPVAPYQQSLFERERRAVEDLISRLLDLQDELEGKAVERWGAEELAAARSLATEGDEAFLAESFDTARTRYQMAIGALEDLLGKAAAAFDAAIKRGQAALEAGQSGDAKEAFELAAAIRPGATAARRGLQRAAVLDDVLTAIRDADRLLARGELEAAKERLEAALALDSETEAAKTALADVRRRIADRDFNAALSRGYAALADGRLDRARAAFQEARRLRPGAAEVEEGLLLVEQDSTDRRIADLRQEAEALLEAEQWAKAAERYADALELDATLSFARQGRSQALTLADLEERMQETLAAPDRLSEDVILDEARKLLGEARAIDQPRPQFAAQIEELSELLAVAAQPVAVVLKSDGATEVTILRVARLGSFEQRNIDLRPGLYTAVGTRPGFRDIRLEFRVAPNPSANEVMIRTEERI
ncbi:MAG: hypothetical protein JJT88_11950 [Gammaproteobacteria bacterium]|nr:hypothetical protein [Gammaproteobacteria bacterium]